MPADRPKQVFAVASTLCRLFLTLSNTADGKVNVTPYKVTLPYDGAVRVTCEMFTARLPACRLELLHEKQLLAVVENGFKLDLDISGLGLQHGGLYCCTLMFTDAKVSSSEACARNFTGHYVFEMFTISSCNDLTVTKE